MVSGSLLTHELELLLVFVVLLFGIYPLVLSGANRLINGFWSSYGRTLGCVVLIGIVAMIVSYIVSRIVGTHHLWLLDVVAVVVTALAGGGIMGNLIKYKDGEPLGFKRAALACLVFGIVVVLISLALSPWQKSLVKQMKANMPAAATSAPAAASTAPAVVSSSAQAAVPATVPVPASSTH